jgi:hypothetical protein
LPARAFGGGFSHSIPRFLRPVASRYRLPVCFDTVHTSKHDSFTGNERRNIMNVLKHMEAAFLVSLSVAGAASLAVDAIPPAQASVPVRAQVEVQPSMPVVHVSAKRMTEAEKRQSLEAERAGSRT